MADLFSVAIRGNMAGYMRAEAGALGKIETIVLRKAGARTKSGIQRQITQAFSDSGQFRNAIKMKSDPQRGFADNVTVRVYSRARYKGKGTRATAFDLLEVWTRDEDVKAAGHDWLAIPTENAPWRQGDGVGRGGAQRKASPHECGEELVFLRLADPNKAVLVTKAANGVRPVIMYVLVRRVHRGRRLDPDAIHAASMARIPDDLAASWAREDARMTAQFGAGLDIGQG